MCRLLALFGVVSSLFFSGLNAFAIAGVTEVPLEVRTVVYDLFTDKLYASAGNNLLQLDASTGAVLDTFYLGTNVTLLSLGAENGIWAALDGEQSICRFDLATQTAGDKIVVSIPNRPIFDLYASPTDPTLALVCLPIITSHWAEALVVRNGAVLPDTALFGGLLNVQLYGALQGSSVYLHIGRTVHKMGLGNRGIVNLGTSVVLPEAALDETVLPFGSNLYSATGIVLDGTSLTTVTNLDTHGVVAVSSGESAVYYLTPTFNAPVLTKVAHPSLQKTTIVELGGIPSPGGFRSMTAYRNHLAFNAVSTLYIVDLDKVGSVRPVAQLEVIQSAPESIEFGSITNVFVTITNGGPSVADVTLTETISSGSAEIVFGAPQFDRTAFTAASPLVRTFSGLQPGQIISYFLTVQPPISGLFTNTVLLTSTNTDPAQVISTRFFNVVLPSGSVTTIEGLSATDVAYDPDAGKLFAATSGSIAVIDPQTPAIWPPLSRGAQQIESSDAGGVLFILSTDGNGIQRLNPIDFTASGFVPNPGPLLDLLASPTDTNLIAVISPTGARLIRNGVALPNATSDTGGAQFSVDGSKLYLVNAADCVLDIFNVDQSGLTLVQTRTNTSCSTFAEADGLIYFSTGTIYDPIADKRSSFGLTAPVFVISRGNQVIDTLARTNGIWMVQRFAGSDRHLVRSAALTKLSSSAGIAQFKPTGPDRVAISAANTLYLVNLAAPSQLSVGVSLRDPATFVIRIDSTPGALYRIETASTVGASNWATVQDNVAGTGGIIETPIPIQAQKNAFFRVVRQ